MRLSLYDTILYLVENNYINPKKLKFNYDKKVILYGGKVIVSEDKCLSKKFLGIPVQDGLSLNVDLGNGFIETIEDLYGEYYHSERNHTKGINFISKKFNASSDIILLLDDSKAEYSRVKLESFLYCVVAGSLYEWEFGEFWYWVSKKYRTLYLYKRWF